MSSTDSSEQKDETMDYNRLTEIAQEHFWPNFGSRQDMQEVPLRILVSGEGAIVRDESGKEYIDCFAAIQTTMVGHGRREIADAVYAQMQKLAFYPAVLTHFTEPALAMLRGGKHLLVEKLMATTSECRQMITAAEAAGMQIMVHFHNRWYPPLAEMHS